MPRIGTTNLIGLLLVHVLEISDRIEDENEKDDEDDRRFVENLGLGSRHPLGSPMRGTVIAQNNTRSG